MHIVECNSDVALVTELASISKKKILHAHGKHRVLRRLIYKNTDSIGMIDKDPWATQPKKYLQKFSRTWFSRIHKLELLCYPHRNNRLIVLHPRLEEWVLAAAGRVGINVRRYNLPSNPDHLHEIINLKLNRFRQLVHDLKQVSDRVKILQSQL